MLMFTNGVFFKSEYIPSHPYIKKGLDMYLLTQFKRWERWGLLYLICIINEMISYGIYWSLESLYDEKDMYHKNWLMKSTGHINSWMKSSTVNMVHVREIINLDELNTHN